MDTILTILPFGVFGLLVALDLLAPARRFPRVAGWRFKGLVFYGAYTGVGILLPMLVDEYLAAHRLIDATSLGIGWGALVAFLALQLGVYLWHRTMHGVPLLWRWFHQMHHSAERVDIFGAFYFHPLDMAGFTLLTSFVLVLGVGVRGEAAAIAATAAGLCSMFQHANLRTPKWLGYIVTRPESHSLHHERGIHGFNYGDIALFDVLFGTFKNPRTWEGEAGFYTGGSSRVLPMLLGRDISTEVQPPPPRPIDTVKGAPSRQRRAA